MRKQSWQKRFAPYAAAVEAVVLAKHPELSGKIGWEEVKHGFWSGWAIERTAEVVIRLAQEQEAR